MPARVLLAFLLGIFLSTHASVWAKAGGQLAGRITDAQTGEALFGATVSVAGTTRGASTDIDGKYTLALESGTYTIEVRSLGYKAKRIEQVVIGQGTQYLSLSLEPSSMQMEEVEVVANVARNNENNLIKDQKLASGVSSGVSAELLARTPDRSMAESLKRISGASVRDGRFAVVRGLQERYNQGVVNGMAQPTTEPDRKAFSLDLFPTALIDKIVIYKTGTPDLPGDFAGGVVSIQTVDIPYANSFSVTAGGEYHSLTTGKTFLQGTTSSTDKFGFDDGTRALPKGIYSREEAALNPGLQTEARQSRLQNNNFAPTRTGTAGPNLYLQAFLGRRGKFLGKDAGMILGLNYYRTLQYSDFLNYNPISGTRDSVKGKFLDFDSLAQRRYRSTVSLSGTANFSFRPDVRSKVAFRNMLVQTGSDLYIQGTGKSIDAGATTQNDRKTYIDFFDQNRFSTHQLTYERAFGTEGARIEALAGASFLQRITPDFKRLIYERGYSIADTAPRPPYLAKMTTVTRDFNPTYSGKFFSDLNETSTNGTLNGTLPVHLAGLKHILKAGTSYQWRERSYQGRNFNFSTSALNAGGGEIGQILQQGPDSIYRPENMGGGLIYSRETTAASDFYSAYTRLTAGYLMAESHFLKNSKLIYGARVERYAQTVRSATLDGKPINATSVVTDWLPSVNGQFGFSERLFLRLAYFGSVNRPEFREFSPSQFYDAAQNTMVYGNPDLVRARIHNFDAKLEYYPADGAVLSLNPYYKRITNAIEQTRVGTSGFPTFSVRNAGLATIRGIEVEVRSNLGFLHGARAEGQNRRGIAEDFTVFANGALIQSVVKVPLDSINSQTRPLQGQSPYTMNVGVTYSHKKLGLDATLVASQVGTRIAYVQDNYESSLWEKPRTIVDASITWRKGRWVTKAIFGDLLAQDLVYFYLASPGLNPLYNLRRDFLGTPRYDKNYDVSFFRTSYGRTIRLTVSYAL